MAFSYDTLEDQIVEYLTPLIPAADVVVLPDNESSFKRALEKPILYVAYVGSDFNPTRSTNEVSQEEIISLAINIRAMTRRGALGTSVMLSSLKRCLLGKRFQHCDRMTLKDIQFEEREPGINYWSYTATFNCKKLCVQNLPDDADVVYPLLKQVNYNDKPVQIGA